MSFGFSIGDFIAVGELAHQLYKDVYMVAKNAPKDIEMLKKDLCELDGCIKLLIEEVQNPNSILNQAGGTRVTMVNEMMEQAKTTLLELQKYAKKHNLVQDAARSKLKRAFDKIGYAKDASKITMLRSKLVHHYSVMGLLLTSLGNSSLERLTEENKAMAQDVAEIKQMIPQTASLNLPIPPLLPQLTSVSDPAISKTLSEMFMEKAELKSNWLAIGLETWMQAGTWWCRKSQASLSQDSTSSLVDTQAYLDLLKAAWIIIDIVPVHPQRLHIHSTLQQRQLKELSTTVLKELDRVRSSGNLVPKMTDLSAADTNIWAENEAMPLESTVSHGLDLTDAIAGVRLFHGLAMYHVSENCQVDSVIEITYQPQNERLNLVAHSAFRNSYLKINAALIDEATYQVHEGSVQMTLKRWTTDYEAATYKFTFLQPTNERQIFTVRFPFVAEVLLLNALLDAVILRAVLTQFASSLPLGIELLTQPRDNASSNLNTNVGRRIESWEAESVLQLGWINNLCFTPKTLMDALEESVTRISQSLNRLNVLAGTTLNDNDFVVDHVLKQLRTLNGPTLGLARRLLIAPTSIEAQHDLAELDLGIDCALLISLVRIFNYDRSRETGTIGSDLATGRFISFRGENEIFRIAWRKLILELVENLPMYYTCRQMFNWFDGAVIIEGVREAEFLEDFTPAEVFLSVVLNPPDLSFFDIVERDLFENLPTRIGTNACLRGVFRRRSLSSLKGAHPASSILMKYKLSEIPADSNDHTRGVISLGKWWLYAKALHTEGRCAMCDLVREVVDYNSSEKSKNRFLDGGEQDYHTYKEKYKSWLRRIEVEMTKFQREDWQPDHAFVLSGQNYSFPDFSETRRRILIGTSKVSFSSS